MSRRSVLFPAPFGPVSAIRSGPRMTSSPIAASSASSPSSVGGVRHGIHRSVESAHPEHGPADRHRRARQRDRDGVVVADRLLRLRQPCLRVRDPRQLDVARPAGRLLGGALARAGRGVRQRAGRGQLPALPVPLGLPGLAPHQVAVLAPDIGGGRADRSSGGGLLGFEHGLVAGQVPAVEP